VLRVKNIKRYKVIKKL